MPTEKLYWDDPFKLAFEAAGAALSTFDGRTSLVLPATRFYPEAGGQLGDTGTLDGRHLRRGRRHADHGRRRHSPHPR